MGGEETRSEEDLDYSGIVRALGSGWRWKFSVVLLCALTATLLLICLAKRASRWWWSRSRRAPPPQPAPPPVPMCTVCRDDVERGEGGVTLPCGHRTTGAASRWPSTTTPGVQSAGRPFRLVTYILLDDQIDPIFSFLVFSDQACSFFVSVTHTIQRS